MNSQLIVSWAEYDAALQRVLLLATARLRIFDHDLARLGLEKRENAENLARYFSADRRNSLCIVVRDATHLRQYCPRLMRLLATYPQQARACECPPEATMAVEALCLADDRHALVGFASDHPRSRLIVDDASACAPYREQFDALLTAGGEPISTTTLGL